MYYFNAHYYDMEQDCDVTKTIKFDGQFIGTEKDCFIYATGKAYDMAEEHEIFFGIELISC